MKMLLLMMMMMMVHLIMCRSLRWDAGNADAFCYYSSLSGGKVEIKVVWGTLADVVDCC
jgi:hypothetical protein